MRNAHTKIAVNAKLEPITPLTVVIGPCLPTIALISSKITIPTATY